MRLSAVEVDHAVRAAQCGDRRAVRDVLDSVRPAVVRYCRARVSGSRGRADELVDRVCSAVLAALPGYRPDDEHFTAFVYRIAAHAVTTAAVPAESLGGSPVDGLPVRHREILILRLVVGLSVEETACALGCTAAAIRLGQHLAVTELRDRTKQRGGAAR